MAGTKLQVLFYFDNMTPQEVNQEFPALLPAIKAAKARTSKINEGRDNEEMTVISQYHICYHNEIPPKPCGEWQEI